MIFSIANGTKQFAFASGANSGLKVLEGLYLSLNTAEILGLLGPSGCGKSTILRIIAGLDTLTSGDLKWSIDRKPFDIGYVFQEATLLNWKTVLDNVLLPFALQGKSEQANSEALELLKWLGLSEFTNYMPLQLSGGMKMRVSIARALITKPKILLMDEPFAALDEVTRFNLQSDVHKICKKIGTSVVFVTHSVSEAAYLADRIVVLSSRPAKVVQEFKFAFSNLNRDMQLRSNPQYLEAVKNVTQAFYPNTTST
jgi:NitT/TauT family transport system ATP-binding protein